MRWSIIRIIWARELRDQLRDRRTVILVAVLPVLLYPIGGYLATQLAQGILHQHHVIGIVGESHLPPGPAPAGVAAVWATPAVPAGGNGLGPLLATAGLLHLHAVDPSLLTQNGGAPRFVDRYLGPSKKDRAMTLRLLPDVEGTDAGDTFLSRIDRGPLRRREVDLLVVVPPDFRERLREDGRPPIYLLTREDDHHSELARSKVVLVLARWKRDLALRRLARVGLTLAEADPFEVRGADRAKRPGPNLGSLFDQMVRFFPFILVLWSLAGALYPAVDLCAGEKERGTMETLLVSPATRTELVMGKFLTIWVFSAATALVNLLSMALTGWWLTRPVADGFHPGAIVWGIVLLLPLSAFFSAIALAVGAYARSTKEGQYYLMPLFLVTMPLMFLTLAPGVELNPFYSMVPVTGVVLLLQELTAAGTPDPKLTLYFLPVLAPMVVYGWIALRWAVEQFNREEVLFREAERLDVGVWLRNLFRDKEPVPSVGQALFCFALILGFRWMSLHVGATWPLLVRTGVGHLAFVITPPVVMALLLTTRPQRGLGLQPAPWWSWPTAIVLAAAVMPPLAGLTAFIVRQFPAIEELLQQYHPLTGELRALLRGEGISTAARVAYFLVLVVLPALSEELAFRGFILGGLRRRLAPWSAILLSSFLFALYQMNVFQLLPFLLLGVVLATLTVHTGSVLPAVLFHLVYNTLVLGPFVFPDRLGALGYKNLGSAGSPGSVLLIAACAALAVAILLVLSRRPVTEAPRG